MATFILIVIMHGVSVTSIEFDDELACKQAALWVQVGEGSKIVEAACFPKRMGL